MTEYLTNDEMSISSLLGVATPTFFINDGNRRNGGEKVSRAMFRALLFYF
jgi:hypothetical protein